MLFQFIPQLGDETRLIHRWRCTKIIQKLKKTELIKINQIKNAHIIVKLNLSEFIFKSFIGKMFFF